MTDTGKTFPGVTILKPSAAILASTASPTGGEREVARLAKTKSGFVLRGKAAAVVRVESYRDRRPVGSLTGPGSGETVRFASLAQLLLTMEGRMDEANLPQRGEEPRAFGWQERARFAGAVRAERRAMATFYIDVLFRQNASWQGSVFWAEQGLESHFRSVLELIRLMDSALSAEME